MTGLRSLVLRLRHLLGGGDASIANARRPEALAASQSSPPMEGLDRLGRDPTPRAPLLYRLLMVAADAFLFGLCRLQLGVEGREHLPAGGYIAVCALHRSWVDPLLLLRALPREPRAWFMGSGPTTFDRRWKERLLHHIGGILPVWRGGTDIAVHVRAAQAGIDQGAVLALFMEGAIGGSLDAVSRSRSGSALLCLRTGAPIVPIALCGAEELYRGKRMALRILEPTTVEALLGDRWTGPPEPGTRDELRTARALTEALAERISAVTRELHPETVDSPGVPHRWRWLTRLMR
jgi:1-acyl-sn-glycerol-3-phosphate acyltransferase